VLHRVSAHHVAVDAEEMGVDGQLLVVYVRWIGSRMRPEQCFKRLHLLQCGRSSAVHEQVQITALHLRLLLHRTGGSYADVRAKDRGRGVAHGGDYVVQHKREYRIRHALRLDDTREGVGLPQTNVSG